MLDNPIVAEVSRGGQVESWHRGALAVCDTRGLRFALGDVERPVYCRSATKPFQALPLVESGAARELGFGNQELALMCASHSGTPAHVAVVERMLGRGGFTVDDLQCGPHEPGDHEAALALQREGRSPGRVHNNCSGKHAGFLHLAKRCGVEPRRHLDPASASQQRVRAAVAEMAGLEVAALGVDIDGCGAPTFRMPLFALARAFARLTNEGELAEPRASACRALVAAMSAEPELYSGPGRFVAALVRALPGKIVPKNGAEGVFALGLPAEGLGLAVKIDDGDERGYYPLVIRALCDHGVLREVPETLQRFARTPVHNTQGVRTGEVACTLAPGTVRS